MTTETARPNALRLNAADNVIIAMRRIAGGEPIRGEGIVTVEPIASGHKIATRPIQAGETVRKYGQVIGAATADIAAGAHVHTHNLAVSTLREGASVGAAAASAGTAATPSRATAGPTARSACATTSAC